MAQGPGGLRVWLSAWKSGSGTSSFGTEAIGAWRFGTGALRLIDVLVEISFQSKRTSSFIGDAAQKGGMGVPV